MGLTLITGPAAEPITIAEARAQCRIDSDVEDGLIAGYLLAARQAAEDFTRRKLYTQTWDFTIDGSWPTEKVNGYWRPRIILPLPPLQAVTHIKYFDTNGVEQTLASNQYRVDPTSYEGRIDAAYGVNWPSVRDQMATITVRMVVGYTALPEPVRLAILQAVAHFDKNRETVVTGTIATELPLTAQHLLFPYRVFY
jgi:uncharacterized phiE125 gp8 family phage protein